MSDGRVYEGNMAAMTSYSPLRMIHGEEVVLEEYNSDDERDTISITSSWSDYDEQDSEDFNDRDYLISTIEVETDSNEYKEIKVKVEYQDDKRSARFHTIRIPRDAGYDGFEYDEENDRVIPKFIRGSWQYEEYNEHERQDMVEENMSKRNEMGGMSPIEYEMHMQLKKQYYKNLVEEMLHPEKVSNSEFHQTRNPDKIEAIHEMSDKEDFVQDLPLIINQNNEENDGVVPNYIKEDHQYEGIDEDKYVDDDRNRAREDDTEEIRNVPQRDEKEQMENELQDLKLQMEKIEEIIRQDNRAREKQHLCNKNFINKQMDEAEQIPNKKFDSVVKRKPEHKDLKNNYNQDERSNEEIPIKVSDEDKAPEYKDESESRKQRVQNQIFKNKTSIQSDYKPEDYNIEDELGELQKMKKIRDEKKKMHLVARTLPEPCSCARITSPVREDDIQEHQDLYRDDNGATFLDLETASTRGHSESAKDKSENTQTRNGTNKSHEASNNSIDRVACIEYTVTDKKTRADTNINLEQNNNLKPIVKDSSESKIEQGNNRENKEIQKESIKIFDNEYSKIWIDKIADAQGNDINLQKAVNQNENIIIRDRLYRIKTKNDGKIALPNTCIEKIFTNIHRWLAHTDKTIMTTFIRRDFVRFNFEQIIQKIVNKCEEYKIIIAPLSKDITILEENEINFQLKNQEIKRDNDLRNIIQMTEIPMRKLIKAYRNPQQSDFLINTIEPVSVGNNKILKRKNNRKLQIYPIQIKQPIRRKQLTISKNDPESGSKKVKIRRVIAHAFAITLRIEGGNATGDLTGGRQSRTEQEKAFYEIPRDNGKDPRTRRQDKKRNKNIEYNEYNLICAVLSVILSYFYILTSILIIQVFYEIF